MQDKKFAEMVPCIFETFGGFEHEVVELLNDWAARARQKTPEGQEPPWSARNFVPYWSQILSTTVQRGAAAEILSRVREETAARKFYDRGSPPYSYPDGPVNHIHTQALSFFTNVNNIFNNFY